MPAEELRANPAVLDEERRVTAGALRKKLKAYIQRACPNAPVRTQDAFTREMTRALTAWAAAPDSERESILDTFQNRMERKLLGLGQVEVALEFSKRRSPNQIAVRQATDKFFTSFFEVVTDFRTDRESPTGQLSFQIKGIDMNDPKLAVVQCTVSDVSLRKKELRHGQGRTNHKKAGRPALIKFDFEAFEGSRFGVEIGSIVAELQRDLSL